MNKFLKINMISIAMILFINTILSAKDIDNIF